MSDPSSPLSGMLHKADQALRSAHLVLDDDDADGCMNRAYYAAFYLASAALWLVGEQPKTHSGAVDRFWVRFVKTGHFPREHARTLRLAFNARQRADYSFVTIHDTAAASDLLEEVEVFAEHARALIERLQEDEL